MLELRRLRFLRRWLLWHISGIRYLRYFSNQNLIIVTGANHNHYASLKQFVASATRFESHSKLIIFDLGLYPSQLSELKDITSTNSLIEIRTFLFDKYPSHMNIEVNAGEYAWKPIIISEICSQFEEFVLWCDSGNIIDKRLSWIRRIIQRDGIYSPYSSGTVSDWTHPGMLSFLNIDDEHRSRKNLNAAVVGLNPCDPLIAKLLNDWRSCAMNVACISPAGSSRINHRQDQAALTVIAIQNGIIKASRPRYINQLWEPLGLRIQCDVVNEQ